MAPALRQLKSSTNVESLGENPALSQEGSWLQVGKNSRCEPDRQEVKGSKFLEQRG